MPRPIVLDSAKSLTEINDAENLTLPKAATNTVGTISALPAGEVQYSISAKQTIVTDGTQYVPTTNYGMILAIVNNAYL